MIVQQVVSWDHLEFSVYVAEESTLPRVTHREVKISHHKLKNAAGQHLYALSTGHFNHSKKLEELWVPQIEQLLNCSI
jgi:hypothetical protein